MEEEREKEAEIRKEEIKVTCWELINKLEIKWEIIIK